MAAGAIPHVLAAVFVREVLVAMSDTATLEFTELTKDLGEKIAGLLGVKKMNWR